MLECSMLKKFYQTFSVVDNSITVLLFGCLVLLSLTQKISKLHERSLRLGQNDYTPSPNELSGKQSLVNIGIKN